jgi:hypothetical protein
MLIIFSVFLLVHYNFYCSGQNIKATHKVSLIDEDLIQQSQGPCVTVLVCYLTLLMSIIIQSKLILRTRNCIYGMCVLLENNINHVLGPHLIA